MGYIVFTNGDMFLIEGPRYVSLVLFEEGLDFFFLSVESSLRPPMILLAVADLSFWPLPMMTNGGVGSYGQFNIQKIWSMCFWRPLLPTVVEHIAPLLWFPRLWSLLLVETVIFVVASSDVPWQWSFLKQWTSPDSRKMQDKDLVA